MIQRKDFPAILVLAVALLCFAGEMVWGGKLPLFRDLGIYFYPMRFSLAASYHAGELPLWDRSVAMGYPLLANFQSGAFYPPHVLYLILPFFTAIQTTFLFHYVAAGVGAYLLCRAWQFPAFLSLIAGLLFTLGGTMVSMTNLLNHFQAAVWLPWVILFAHNIIQKRTWKNFLIFTAVLTTQFLAGSPEIYLMTQVLVVLYGCHAQAAVTRDGGIGKFMLTLAAADLLVAGLSMVQILPTVELLAESRAREAFTLDQASAWSSRLVNLLNFFFVDKEINVASYTSPKLFFSNETPLMISYYMGALIPVGSLFWLYYGSRKEKLVVSALIVFSLALAMGSNGPVYPFLFAHIHVFRVFRFPEKFVFLTYAAILFAGLRGFREFLKSDRDWRRPFYLASLLGIAELLLYGYLRWDPEPLRRFIDWSIESSVGPLWTIRRSSMALQQLEIEVVLVFGILLLLTLKKSGKLRQSLFAALLTVLVFIDLYGAHRSSQFLFSPEVIARSPRIVQQPDARPDRIFFYPGSSDVHPSYFTLPRELPLNQFHSVAFGNLLPATGVLFGFEYMQEIDAMARWPYLAFLAEARKLEQAQLFRLLAALNVEYVTSFRPLQESGLKLFRSVPERYSWVYKIDNAVPRAYIVFRTTQETDGRKTLRRLASGAVNPLQEAFVEKPSPYPSRSGGLARVNIARYENTSVNIEAALDAPGMLVLADSYYPGWHVYVDGKEEEIVRTNVFFRGVQLTPGEHRVEFRYKPQSFRLGALVSIATLFGLIFVSGMLRLKRKRQG
jgi:hypothetical protein